MKNKFKNDDVFFLPNIINNHIINISINYFKKNIKKKLRELIWLKKVKKVYNSL